MLTKRIIPCLDVKDGRTVKGTNFINLKDAGNPVELAYKYAKDGADELVFLDISATLEKRKTLASLVNDVAATINIPFTVGGGISSIADVEVLLKNGADKISINSSAYKNPNLIEQLAKEFGSQCIVVAIDTKQQANGDWLVYLNGGQLATTTLCATWATTAYNLGAGEILLTSMNNDGTKQGFAIDITQQLATTLPIPIIASGGGGNEQHFKEVFQIAKADAALAASIFHFGEVSIGNLKAYLKNNSIEVRL